MSNKWSFRAEHRENFYFSLEMCILHFTESNLFLKNILFGECVRRFICSSMLCLLTNVHSLKKGNLFRLKVSHRLTTNISSSIETLMMRFRACALPLSLSLFAFSPTRILSLVFCSAKFQFCLALQMSRVSVLE